MREKISSTNKATVLIRRSSNKCRSLPSPCLSEKLLGEEKRTNSISSLPVILTPSKEVDRYSAIISTLR